MKEHKVYSNSSHYKLFDTHAHIHDSSYAFSGSVVLDARSAHVERIVCVGTDPKTSREACDFASQHEGIWASIGIHPHEASLYCNDSISLSQFEALLKKPRVVAIGECGLDYFYEHSAKEDQKELLRYQLDLAKKYDLAVIFHARNAFEDFWPIFDEYKGIRGVLHSFTDTQQNLDEAIKRGLFIGVNGIMTFTKDMRQLDVLRSIPADRILLETDSPYLTPAPKRGTMNEPKNLELVASFVAECRNTTITDIANTSYENANRLFSL